MALFEGYKRIEGSRSNTHLIKSGHMSPAEEWLLDPRFRASEMSAIFKDGVLFNYEYGGAGNEEVVIPKGRVVGVGRPVKDFTTKKFKTVLTLPGMATANNVVGMVPYNITKDWFQLDRFGGNQPSIITMDYVALPYIPGVAASNNYSVAGVLEEEQKLSVDLKMPWGSVIGADVKEGDYVKATPSGRLAKWDRATDNPADIVGQVLAVDFNQEPWGWMKWMLWDEAAMMEDDAYMNRSGASNLPTDYGYPYDPSYKEGNTIFQQYQTQWINNPTGIPGLHDGSGNYLGYGKNDTEYTDIVLGEVPAGISNGTLMAFQAKDFAGGNLTNLKELINVKIAGVAVPADKITVNYTKGVITVNLDAVDAGKEVTATYKAYHYGTPSYLDFKGVAGSLFILLKR